MSLEFSKVKEFLRNEHGVNLDESSIKEFEIAHLAYQVTKSHYEEEAIKLMEYYDNVGNNPRKEEETGKLS